MKLYALQIIHLLSYLHLLFLLVLTGTFFQF